MRHGTDSLLNTVAGCVLARTPLCLAVVMAACLLAACGGAEQGDAAGGAAAPERIHNWKMVTSWPKNFPGLGTGAERFAQSLEAMSGGRLRVRVYSAGELVPALEVFDAVSQGTVQLGHSAAYYWKGKLPAAQFFTAVPFGLTAQEINGWLHHGGGLALYRELYEPFDILPLAVGNTGVQMAGWFNRELVDADSLRGLKMRLPGLGGEVWRRVGGTAVTLPGSEIYTAMRTGVIDATEWVGPYNDMALGLHEVARYYYYPGWHEPGSSMELSINTDAWAELPPDLQAIVEAAARVANQDMLDEYTVRNAASLRELRERHGIEPTPLPRSVLRALWHASVEVVAELARSDPKAERIYRHWKRYADDVYDYHRLSEQAYLEAREVARDENASVR